MELDIWIPQLNISFEFQVWPPSPPLLSSPVPSPTTLSHLLPPLSPLLSLPPLSSRPILTHNDQDSYHYVSTWYTQRTLDNLQQNDNIHTKKVDRKETKREEEKERRKDKQKDIERSKRRGRMNNLIYIKIQRRPSHCKRVLV